jgi:hypothetical protein
LFHQPPYQVRAFITGNPVICSDLSKADDCLKLERRGESHGFLDSECIWDGDRLSVRFYAHGLSGGETAQGH